MQNKDKSHLKVAKIDDFNEFRSFCVQKSIGIARIIVSLQCHKYISLLSTKNR